MTCTDSLNQSGKFSILSHTKALILWVKGMKGKELLYSLLFLPVTYGLLAAQPSALRLDVDYSQFRGTGDSAYVELYYAFNSGALTYTESNGSFVGAVELDVRIFDGSRRDRIVKERQFRMNSTATDTGAGTVGKNVVGLSGLFIPPGSYHVSVVGRDIANPDVADSVTFELNIREIPRRHISLSDIQFANSIRQIPEDPHNTFYKNTLEVIPNPSRVFGLGHPILFYYLELYNLLVNAEIGDEYKVRAIVLDAVGNQYHEREYSKNRRYESSVEVGTVNTSAYRSGTYTLSISVIDSASNVVANVSRRFFVFNPQHGVAEEARDATPQGVIASVYAVMSEEELDKEFEQMRYITTAQDRREYNRLRTKAEKQQFLFEFWRRLDPDPSTASNPVREEYFERVRHANQQFGFGFREGWRTDRGRVFIVYGPPDDYERYPSRSDTKPYEIWHYHDIQGGVIFVFVDRTGFQDYQLVHSTHRNELRDDNWRYYILQN